MKLLYTAVTFALVMAVSGIHQNGKHSKHTLQGKLHYVLADGTEVVEDPDNKSDIQDEINLTPYLRLTKENQWLAGVPNYEDPKEGYLTKVFLKEKVARKWIYSKSAAHQSINYPMASGLDPVNGGVGEASFILLAGSGSDAGSEGSDAGSDAGDVAAAFLEMGSGEGSGSEEEGSGSEGSAAEEAPAASAFCQECQDKLDAINARIADVEQKIAARKDGGAITGITATKGEIVDVAIHREGDEIAAIEESAGSGSDAGSDAASDAGSDAGSASAAAFLEMFSEMGSGSGSDAASDAAGSGSDSGAAFIELFSQMGSGSDAGSDAGGSGSGSDAGVPAAAFIEKMKALRGRKQH